jgi:capsid protein
MLAIIDGGLKLPGKMTLNELQWEWVPVGMPWWDPAKEINGDLLAIGAGLDNPQRIVKERGRGDWYDNVDRIAEAHAYAKSKGLDLSFMPQPNQIVVQEVEE